MINEKTLIIIPARKGSKGVVDKNIREFKGKPLIKYTIDFAIENKKKEDIVCLSTNDNRIIELYNQIKDLDILKRPEQLSRDNSGMSEVIKHALDYYESKQLIFHYILLLQPTSPLRNKEDYKNLTESMKKDFDMVVSVCESKENPYFSLYEENNFGYLSRSKPSNYANRQECPKVYKFNGAFYLIKAKAFKEFGLHGIKKISKITMPEKRSIDIDSELDFKLAEFLAS